MWYCFSKWFNNFLFLKSYKILKASQLCRYFDHFWVKIPWNKIWRQRILYNVLIKKMLFGLGQGREAREKEFRLWFGFIIISSDSKENSKIEMTFKDYSTLTQGKRDCTVFLSAKILRKIPRKSKWNNFNVKALIDRNKSNTLSTENLRILGVLLYVLNIHNLNLVRKVVQLNPFEFTKVQNVLWKTAPKQVKKAKGTYICSYIQNKMMLENNFLLSFLS